MTHTYRQNLEFPRPEVWDWHTRPGAVTRLTPGFAHVHVASEASSLRDGTTVLRLPGLRWDARHLPGSFREGSHFADECSNAPVKQLTRWRHHHDLADAPATDTAQDGTLLTDSVDTTAPSALLDRIFAYRHRQLTEDLTFLSHQDHGAPRHTVAVTGATGLVGTRLTALLRSTGHTVVPLSRSAQPNEPDARIWDPGHPDPELLRGVDTVVHLAGASIAGRFTDRHKAKVRDSRVGPTHRLADLAAATDGVGSFVCASAIGFYGHARAGRVTEQAGAGDGFLARVVSDWEAACSPAADAGLRVVNIRTGIVLGGGSPLLSALTASSRAGGGVLGNGRQHFAWISLEDLVDIYHRAIVGVPGSETLHGPVNAVAPELLTNAEFTDTLGELLRFRVPTSIPAPAAAPALLLGVQGAEELALADQNVSPRVLEKANHRFRHPRLRTALVHELGLSGG